MSLKNKGSYELFVWEIDLFWHMYFVLVEWMYYLSYISSLFVVYFLSAISWRFYKSVY